MNQGSDSNSKKPSPWKAVWNRSRRNSSRRMAVENLETRELLAAYITGVSTSYSTIQAAVDAAQPGATITVGPGTYNESVAIYKPLTLLGNNAGVDARGSGRKAETVVYDPLDAFVVGASGVTINGFTIQGADANVGGGLAGGVYMKPNIHGTKVLDNIIHDNVSGILLSNNSDTDPCIIQGNSFYNNFESGFQWWYGWNGNRSIYSDGTVSGGLLTNVWIDSNKFYVDAGFDGVGTIGLEAQNAGKQFNVTISRNTFSSVNTDMSKAILAYNITNLSLIGNEASGTNDDGSGAFRFEGNTDNVNIQYNNVHDNNGPGVAVDPKVASDPSSNFVVNYNNFYNNGLIGHSSNAGVIYDPGYYTGPFDARYNYWGSSNGPRGDGPGSGDGVYGNAVLNHYSWGSAWTINGKGSETFSPWLTSAVNISAIPAPAAPTGLSAAVLSSSSVRLTWTAAYSTAFNEIVQRSADGGKTWTTAATVSPLVNSFTDTGLTTATTYSYRIAGSNATGNSSPSNVASVTPPAYQPPVPPGPITVNATTNTTVTLSWAAPPVTLGITGYVVYRNGTAITTVSAGTTTYTDSGLNPGIGYAYSVATQDNTNAVSNPSATVVAVTTGTPAAGRLTGTPIGTAGSWGNYGNTIANVFDGNLNTFFDAPGPNGGWAGLDFGSAQTVSQIAFAPRTGFSGRMAGGVFQSSNTPDFSSGVSTVYTITTTPAEGTLTTVTLTIPVTGRYFRYLSPSNGYGNIAELQLFAPGSVSAAPTNLTASGIGPNQINLTWTTVVGVQPTNLLLQRSTDGNTFTNVGTLSGNATSCSDTGLTSGTNYTYRLIAVNAAGSSAPSATASATTLSAAAIKTPLSSLAWTSATSGYKTSQVNASVIGNPITIRNTTYATGIGTHAVSTIVYNIGGKYLAFTGTVGIDDETAVGGAVDFQIIGDGQLLFDSGIVTRTSAPSNFAVNVAGIKTLTLQATNGVTGSIDYDHADWAGVTLLSNPAAPSTPANLVAKAAGTTSAMLTWTAGDTSQTGFKVDRSADNGATWTTIATPAQAAYTDTGLTPGASYLYRVRATNTVGDSTNSATAALTLPLQSTALSSLTPMSAVQSWGSLGINQSVKGTPLTLAGRTYASGLGTHAAGTLTYNLGGSYQSFSSTIGLDDEIGTRTADPVVFQVIGDGKVLYSSPTITGAGQVYAVNISVAGVKTLQLVIVSVNPGSIDYDHADWAGATLA